MRLIHILLAITLFWGLVQPTSASQTAALPLRISSTRVLLDRGDRAGLAWLLRAGARQLSDYTSFSLWSVPPAALGPAGTGQVASSLQPVNTPIRLRGLSIDPDSPHPEPALPAGLAASGAPDANPRLWILQFAGPLRPAWLKVWPRMA